MRLVPLTDATLADAVRVLRSGGSVVHATETCYGIACDISHAEAVARVFRVKKRPLEQPVSALFPSVDEAKKYVEWPPRAEELATAHLPGPLTLILPLRDDAPRLLYPLPTGGVTIGVRVSSHPLAQRLASLFGSPLTTTSANIHGEANPYDPGEILARFERERADSPDAAVPDLILDSGVLPPNPPSTVVDLAGGSGIKRKGTIG